IKKGKLRMQCKKTPKSKSEIEYTKGLLRKEFDMKELGPARKILGMEIVKDRVGLCAIGSTLQGIFEGLSVE
ncbi:hypothetical protein Tco_0358058, partial [Tanacetum coccineum]